MTRALTNEEFNSIGRPKDANYSKPSYDDNKEESNGNTVEADTKVEADGNSFTANADEFFSADELTNA